MSTETNLRQSENLVKVEGVLAEKSLEKKIGDQNSTHPGLPYWSGYLTIKTSDTNQIRFSIMNIWEKKKDGTDNSIFKSMETIANEYKDVATYGAEEADRIRINNGDINPYTDKNGRSQMGYRSNFFNRVTDDSYSPHAEVSVETYISAILPEVDKEGVETGRYIVKGWTNLYNGVEPVDFILPSESVSGFESVYEVGMTAKLFADIVNERIEVIKETPMAFGKPRVDKIVSYKSEWVLNGGSEPYEEGVSEHAPYSKDAIQLAIQERENRIAEKENKRLNNANPFTQKSTPSAAEKGRQISW